MSTKPVIPRAQANRDVDEALDHYLTNAGIQAALSLVDALEAAYIHISHHPATGSLRYAHALDLPGLRFWPLTRYPYLVLYLDRGTHIDVWRVLHEKRDIPGWLHSEEDL